MDNKIISKPKGKPKVEETKEKEPKDYFWLIIVGCILLTILAAMCHNMTH